MRIYWTVLLSIFRLCFSLTAFCRYWVREMKKEYEKQQKKGVEPVKERNYLFRYGQSLQRQ